MHPQKASLMQPPWPLVLALVAVGILAAPGRGQAPQPENRPQPRMGHAVRSPQVQPDGRVQFRFHAPNAKQVFLAREGMPRLAMSKDDRGTWSITTDVLQPDLYCYQFVVDGVVLADPANPMCKPIVTGGHESIVHVPGPASLSWEPQDVPHRTLHRHVYQSRVLGEARPLLVYTPPGYDPAAAQTYPVLYLLHGVMDDETAWTTAGQTHVILDNLIARRKARPMLVVMPLGYGFPNVPDRMREQFGAPAGQQKIMDALTRLLLDEVIPQVERDYRVTRDREARAIAGLSMGGSQALSIGLNHRDRFAWIGSFSGALIMYGQPFGKWFPDLKVRADSRVRLLWLACGTEDFLLGVNRNYKEWLKTNEVPFTAVETPGAHAWQVWRRNLTEFVPLLFQPRADSRD
jgi:enterochelin esterase family protein